MAAPATRLLAKLGLVSLGNQKGSLVASWADLAFRVALAQNPEAPLETLLAAADFSVGEHLRAMHPGATPNELYAGGPHTTVVLARVLPGRLDYALMQDSSLLVWADGAGALTQLKGSLTQLKGSANRRKSAQSLARLHWRIACVRNDALH